MGQLPPFRADVRRRCSRHEAQEQDRHRSLRGNHGQSQGRERLQTRHRTHRRRPQEPRSTLQIRRQGIHRQRLPRQCMGTALGRHLRRIRQLDERTRHHLPPNEPDSRRMGNRSERSGNGIRQHGQQLSHRCCLQPRCSHR